MRKPSKKIVLTAENSCSLDALLHRKKYGHGSGTQTQPDLCKYCDGEIPPKNKRHPGDEWCHICPGCPDCKEFVVSLRGRIKDLEIALEKSLEGYCDRCDLECGKPCPDLSELRKELRSE